MIAQALMYIIETLTELFVLAALVRFYAQAFRAPFRNPVTDFVVALTDWAVKPLRKIFPGMMGLDTASFLLAWVLLFAMFLAIFALRGWATVESAIFWPSLLLVSLVRLLKLSLYLLIGLLIVQAILSWTGPYHPLKPFFDAMTRPFLRPLRRIVPLVGGVDLSPLVLLILLQVVLMLPIAFLEFQADIVIRRLALQ
jgi:YggT family protein